MGYLFHVACGPQKQWRKELVEALEKQAVLSYERAHPESLKKKKEVDPDMKRRQRFGIAMAILGVVLAAMSLKDLREQWVVLVMGVLFLAWGIAHLLPKPEYRRRYKRAAKVLTQQREQLQPTDLAFRDDGMAFEDTLVPYENFDMVVATPGLYLLAWDNGSVLYVPKEDMTDGDPVEFTRFLSKKTGKKVIKIG